MAEILAEEACHERSRPGGAQWSDRDLEARIEALKTEAIRRELRRAEGVDFLQSAEIGDGPTSLLASRLPPPSGYPEKAPDYLGAPLANSVTQTDPSATAAADGSLINEFNP